MLLIDDDEGHCKKIYIPSLNNILYRKKFDFGRLTRMFIVYYSHTLPQRSCESGILRRHTSHETTVHSVSKRL